MERDFIGYGPTPPDAQWPGGAKVALNIVLNYEEGSEPSFPDGDGVTEAGLTDGGRGGLRRDLAAESMFEYGSRVGVWRLLRILAAQDAPATVFGCAVALDRNPAVVAAIRQAGHDLCCHGNRWVDHQVMAEDEERGQIAQAVGTLTRLFGSAPEGWYCRYGPGLNTRRLLVEHGGFLYDSDAYNDELPYWRVVEGRPHLVVPYSLVNNDARFIRGSFSLAEDFFTYLRDTAGLLLRERHSTMMSVGLHMRLAGHPGRALALERFLDWVRGQPGIWLCRRIDIARHWAAMHPYRGP